jgi:hypothetical protein
MEQNTWYLEYKIHNNRPGLLGDIASMLGMLQINILTINGVQHQTRGLLLQTEDTEKIEVLEKMIAKIESITLNKLRSPTILDRLAVRHGRYIERDSDDRNTFRFTRDELGMLVDFLGQVFKQKGHLLVGLRGMPRVGKTESIIAGSVSSQKKWTFVSSTFLRQTVRSQLNDDEWNHNNLFIIDGIMSTIRSNERHYNLIQKLMKFPAVKVIEHPDIFVRESEYELSDFHYIIELRNNPEEQIIIDTFAQPLDDDFNY